MENSLWNVHSEFPQTGYPIRLSLTVKVKVNFLPEPSSPSRV